MRKRAFAMVLAGMMALSLGACGGQGSPAPASSGAGEGAAAGAGGAGQEAAGAAAAAPAGDGKAFKLATDAALDYPTTMALQSFADEVKEKTDGRIAITIYPSAQLGDENAYLQQLQFGAVDFAKSSVAPLAQFCDDLNALSLPYLFDSTEHMFRCLDGPIGEEIFASFEAANIVGLGFTDNGSRCFFTKTPVQKAGDLANKKIRVQSSPLMLGMVEGLGGFPQAIASTELYSALQTGIVDGAENNINTYAGDSLYEQAPYFIYDHHNIQPEIIIASKKTWDGLSAEDRAIIQTAMDNAMAYQKELWAEREKSSEDMLKEAGVTFYTPTEEELAGFREKCQGIYEDEKLGKPYEAFVAKVRAVE